ncbi:MAG: hypothetical protein K9M49_07300 [Candidatus Marinimicrobia bacterium]|nr:hypothetical protein [Candidatus Neomarinimicrobiota bacterium]MCF7850344.1 hypothetical protein [Candidatus Neomarinimicrobiota bacterium]MCF7904947.1 hypothetical protein [Candidatus Neomarinimicrobiota bacterium]
MRAITYTCIVVISFLIMACGQKFELPTESYSEPPVFGAGKKSYIRISPDWDAGHGYDFQKPWDLVVGADGYIFVADREQGAVHTISAAGVEIISDEFGNDFSTLSSLNAPDGSPIYPMAIAQDSRLNLFIADSSNRLFVWDQYLNNVGVDSMASAVQLRSSNDSLIWVTNFDSINTLMTDGWDIETINWSAENLDQWLSPRLFWDAGVTQEAIEVAKYFIKPDSVRVTGVGTSGDLCRLADAFSDAILTLAYVPEALLKTAAGQEIIVYSGTIVDRTVSTGTGNGTVNDPRGLTHDQEGAIYYTQWGENFSVHKVGGGSGFEYGEDEIMEIDRFDHASDVALDGAGNIYIADSGHDLIQQFSPLGAFVYNIGTSKVVVDSSIVDSVLVGSTYEMVRRDTSIQVEIADNLSNPRSVAVDATGVVYIADTENNRIMRYRLSTELDYSTGN